MDKLDVVVPKRKNYVMEACFGRWKELTTELKGREPHSPCSLNIALFRVSMYEDVIRRLKLEWIGQKMASPLFPTLNHEESINEEKARKDWEQIEEATRYVKKDEPNRIIAYNAREQITRHHQEETTSQQ